MDTVVIQLIHNTIITESAKTELMQEYPKQTAKYNFTVLMNWWCQREWMVLFLLRPGLKEPVLNPLSLGTAIGLMDVEK